MDISFSSSFVCSLFFAKMIPQEYDGTFGKMLSDCCSLLGLCYLQIFVSRNT